MSNNIQSKNKTLALVQIALFAVMIALCSWITIPSVVPFTLQTFAVFCTLGFLGGKRGVISVAVYILAGFAGAPVFSGFSGGAGKLLGPTGGYIIGFVFMALIYWLFTRLFGKKTVVTVIAMLLGLLVLYAFGTAWFMIIYTKSPIGLATALGWCVFPFIIPDIVKMAVAVLLVKRLSPYISKSRVSP